MAATQVGATDNPNEPIAANTLNSTKAAGLGALTIAVAGGLGNSLDLFKGEGPAVKIAVFATVAVALAVFGYGEDEPVFTAAHAIDADDVGAIVAQQGGAERSRDVAAQIQDLDALEHSHWVLLPQP